jgi:tetratricopeptide (TPR) repeat protein
MALAEEAEAQLLGPDQAAWLLRLHHEHDNVRAALQWAAEHGEAEVGLRLATALWRYWYARGYLSEGRCWFDTLLAADVPSLRQGLVRARALMWAAALATEQGDYERAVTLAEQSLALYQEAGDAWGLAFSHNILGHVAHFQGDYDRATMLYRVALAYRPALGETWITSVLLTNLGVVAQLQGDHGRAATLYTEALAIERRLGDTWGVAMLLDNLGDAARLHGDHPQAGKLMEEALALRRRLGDPWGIADSLSNLGLIAQEQGDGARAASLYAESLAFYRKVGDRVRVAMSLEALARLAATRTAPEGAVRLLGAAASLRDAIGTPLPPADRAALDQTLAALRAALGEDRFGPAWAAGQMLPPEQASEEAMGLAAG